jgi:purine nucleosidase
MARFWGTRLMAVSRARAGNERNAVTKVIIDTDTGVDDGMGLLYALVSPELEIVGVTTSFGNVDVGKVTRNTAIILERLGCPAPLGKGADRSLVGEEPTFNPHIHGEDGFGNANLPDPRYTNLADVSAAELTIRLANQHPGELTWIGLGPVTNLALAVLLDPSLPSRLDRIVWMGGAAMHHGNVSPVAEADALHDPEALALVLDQNWQFVQVGLDVTDDTIFGEAELAAVRSATSPAAKLVAAGAPAYMSFYEPILGRYACAMHSPLTVAVVAHPELILDQQPYRIRVETEGRYTRGMTVVDRRHGRDVGPVWADAPLAEVVLAVDRETFVKRYVKRITA